MWKLCRWFVCSSSNKGAMAGNRHLQIADTKYDLVTSRKCVNIYLITVCGGGRGSGQFRTANSYFIRTHSHSGFRNVTDDMCLKQLLRKAKRDERTNMSEQPVLE